MTTILPVAFGLLVTAAVLAVPWAAQVMRRRFAPAQPPRGPETCRGAVPARPAPRQAVTVQPPAEPAHPFGFDSGVIIGAAPARGDDE